MITSGLLYARIGIPHCPNCGKAIERQTADQMADIIDELPGEDEDTASGSGGKGQKGPP